VKCLKNRIQGVEGQSPSLKLRRAKRVRVICLEIYRITAKFPREERYGLTSQIRRSVVSIPSNIAEGYGRKTTLDYVRMLYISYGSVCELETQILLAGDLDLIEKGELGTLNKAIAEIERMLKALIKSLENKPLNP